MRIIKTDYHGEIKDTDIASINTCNPRLARMSWLVKTPNNPDGIEGDKLILMSDKEIFSAYDKWSEKNKK